RLPVRRVRERPGLPERGRARSHRAGPRAEPAARDQLTLSGVERLGPEPDRRVVYLDRATGPHAPVLRLPLLQRGSGHRPARARAAARRGAAERLGPERLHGRYLSAVHFDDALIGRVLDDLGRRKLLDRTVVIVTSDHGLEFDDNGLGFT